MISLAEILGGDASGFAIERGGILLVDTVASTAIDAIQAALLDAGFEVESNCDAPGCNCMELILKRFVPDAVVVEVHIRGAE